MSAMKLPRRLPTRPRQEAIEREEYIDAPAPVNPVRRTFAVMTPKPPVVTVEDDDDDLPPFARPGAYTPLPCDGPVRLFTRKS